MKTATMTYGILPKRAEFDRAFERNCPSGYRVALGASDTRTFYAVCDGREFGDAVDTWTADQTWNALSALTEAWGQGDDDAGDLASTILTTLDFEWI